MTQERKNKNAFNGVVSKQECACTLIYIPEKIRIYTCGMTLHVSIKRLSVLINAS